MRRKCRDQAAYAHDPLGLDTLATQYGDDSRRPATRPALTNSFQTHPIDIYLGRHRIRSHFDKLLAGEIHPFISVITEAELWRGLRAGELEMHQALVAQFTILPLRSDAARLAGGWMQRYQADGLGWMDALIAATAKVNRIALLTRDQKLARLLGEDADFVLYG